jgi:hypothetical protein
MPCEWSEDGIAVNPDWAPDVVEVMDRPAFPLRPEDWQERGYLTPWMIGVRSAVLGRLVRQGLVDGIAWRLTSGGWAWHVTVESWDRYSGQ